MRAMSRRDRNLLNQGPLVDIIDHSGSKITKIPLALFKAASTDQELVTNGKITVPDNYDLDQVKRLVFLMLKVASAEKVDDFEPTENVCVDLHFHSAAEYLGMGSFTQNIFDLYFKRVNKVVPAVDNIEAIGSVRTPPGHKIHKQMAYNIGVRYYEDKIANRAQFERYLDTNPRLHEAVTEVVVLKQTIAQREEQKRASHQAFLERERKRAAKAESKAEWEQRMWMKQAEKNVLHTKREAQKKKETEVKQRMIEKRRLGQKLNPEEARAYEKQYGRYTTC
jgi:hypothetical protein